MLRSMSWWDSLSGRFLLVGGTVLALVMMLTGYFVSALVTSGVVHDKAASTAILMQAMISDVVSELAGEQRLSPSAVHRLDEIFDDPGFLRNYPFVEIWKPDGEIAYSNSEDLIGSRFRTPPGLLRALAGEIAAEYTDPLAAEHTTRGIKDRFLEIYSPLRDRHGTIIAVIETHEIEQDLEKKLHQLVLTTWSIVAGGTLLLMACLWTVVNRAERTISRQASDLRQRVIETERVSEQNRLLKLRGQRASARVSDINEKFLKGLGADLHDGPAQMLSFAMLQLGHTAGIPEGPERDVAQKTLATTLQQALAEIRTISKGLILPDIENRPLNEVIMSAVKTHEARTGTSVDVSVQTFNGVPQNAVATCVYRFVQEGLTNAYRHASAQEQCVSCNVCGTDLVVTVSNAGPQPNLAGAETGMGLFGLRGRVESLGGTLWFGAGPNGGARLQMTLELDGKSLVD